MSIQPFDFTTLPDDTDGPLTPLLGTPFDSFTLRELGGAAAGSGMVSLAWHAFEASDGTAVEGWESVWQWRLQVYQQAFLAQSRLLWSHLPLEVHETAWTLLVDHVEAYSNWECGPEAYDSLVLVARIMSLAAVTFGGNPLDLGRFAGPVNDPTIGNAGCGRWEVTEL